VADAPNGGVRHDRRLEADDVAALLRNTPPPQVRMLRRISAQRTVVVRRGEAA
jgi:hypothetical protein